VLKVTVDNYKDARDCPFRNVLDKIGDKWSFLIFAVLEDCIMNTSWRNSLHDGYFSSQNAGEGIFRGAQPSLGPARSFVGGKHTCD
jgi:hypothetical protein